MTSRDASIARGKALIAAVIATFFTESLFGVVFKAGRFDTNGGLVSFVISAGTSALLCYAMWRGKPWGRWIFAAFMAIAALIIVIAALRTMNWRVWVMAVYQSLIPAVLCFADSIDDFMEYQRTRLKEPNQPPEPTVMSVTPRADARVAPATTVAHL